MKPQVTKISKYVKDNIDRIDGSTMDAKVNNLISAVEHMMPFVEYNVERSSMKLYPKTLERLDTFKISNGESRDNILTRMVITLDEMNNTSATDEWILFKLTNPYNNSLVISGQLEYNSKEISFNYRGNVFRGKLPPTYIANGTDLTKELYLWYDRLDWREIADLICENIEKPAKIERSDFTLEVNCS